MVLSARNMNWTFALADRLISQGYEAHTRQVDAGNAQDVAALVNQVESQFGALDVLHY